jgi:tRNA-dihydrouridine synthase B
MTEAQLISHLKANPFVLAPMAGITDCAFRSFMKSMGASVVVTELVSAVGLKYSSDRTRALMKFTADQSPIGIQIFGEDFEALRYAAQEVEQMGADFVDINFGCPVPKVVKKGAGSAALKDLNFLRQVVHSVKSSVSIPVTIKVRTGWDHNTKNTHEVVKIAKDEGVAWVAIHGRTRAQGYSGQSDWDYIKEVKSSSPLPVIGNGDINSAKSALARLDESNCDAVMIGRGCLKNPWIFLESMSLYNNQTATIDKDFLAVIRKLKSCLQEHLDEKMVGLQLKKFSAWYSAGFEGSANFRRNVFKQTTHSEVIGVIEEFFGTVRRDERLDTSGEDFLMGGHG